MLTREILQLLETMPGSKEMRQNICERVEKYRSNPVSTEDELKKIFNWDSTNLSESFFMLSCLEDLMMDEKTISKHVAQRDVEAKK